MINDVFLFAYGVLYALATIVSTNIFGSMIFGICLGCTISYVVTSSVDKPTYDMCMAERNTKPKKEKKKPKQKKK